jgi:hypothetical protein
LRPQHSRETEKAAENENQFSETREGRRLKTVEFSKRKEIQNRKVVFVSLGQQFMQTTGQ